MGRYSKFNSSYILAKQHQTIDGGVIIERDWVTVGERNNIGPGKKRVSYDGNFLFTENTDSMAYRKATPGRWVGSYNYDDVKDANEKVNKVILNTTTDNPLVFAYYGALYDKVEGAITNIIEYFPGNIVFGKTQFTPYTPGYNFPDNLSQIKNDFEINFISTPKNLTKYDNEMRYMTISWNDYVIVLDGVEYQITNYSVINKQTNIWEVEKVYIGDGELFKYNGRYYKRDKSTGQFIDIDIVESNNYFIKCGEYIKYHDDYYKWNDDDSMYRKLPIEKVCEPEVYELFEVVFTANDECNNEFSHSIHIYRLYNGIVYVNDITDHEIEIRPKNEKIEAYFESLTGIEANLLNRKSNPNYSFDMILCEKDDMGNFRRVRKTLSWPKDHDGYCIDINSSSFNTFIENILLSAENYDEYFSDNLWRNMTHESIKNYDWSYERDGDENDVFDEKIGSNRVCNVLRLIGMEFDELKMYIEGITSSNKLTYNGFLNMPDSEVVNALEMGGFDTFSTIWNQDEYQEISESEVPENVYPNNYFTLPSPESVLDDYITVGCDGVGDGTHYYKRVSTIGDEVRLDYSFFYPDDENSYHIVKKDPWISNNYSGYAYRPLIFKPSDVTEDYWTSRNTFNTPPTVGSRFSPKYVKVIMNGDDVKYYEKVSTFDNNEYMHSNWFEKLDPNYFSQSVVDIDFMRRLGLSAKNIFATKGTAHAIDMIMAVFGFGRENDLQMSDYKLTEPYHEIEPIPFDDDFYYYTPLQEAPSDVVYGITSTFAILPLNITGDDTMFPLNIRVDDGFGGYYYFEKTKKKASEVVLEIYSSILESSNENSEYPGFPLATTFINGKKYFIPFMSDKYLYHGDLYFQSKGGWCKKSDLNSGKYDYTETVPYIKSVNEPLNLLVNDGTIFNVGDYVYVKYPLTNSSDFNINPNHVSNYFKLVAQDQTVPQSWRNVPLDGPIVFDNYVNDDTLAPTHDDYVNVKFIDEIIFTNIANNPHKGNGKYDAGADYLAYMKLPFKYSVDNASSNFSDYVKLSMAKQFAFKMSNYKYDMPKAYYWENVYVYEQIEDEPGVSDNYWSSLNTLEAIPQTIYPSSPDFIRIKGANNEYVYFKKTKIETENLKYFLNSKVVIMKNLINNTLYKRYFNSIILPYLLQVVPSTTIFILENFNECEEHTGTSSLIQVFSNNPDCGSVTGGGTYYDCDYAVLTATPNENCHFVMWQQIDCETEEVIPTEMDMTTQTIMPKVVGNACYLAIFEENCIITLRNGLDVCENITYYNDVSYGRILYNGEREFRLGYEYIIADDVTDYFLTCEPLNGYRYETWTVFNNGNDVTQELIDETIIDITDSRISIFYTSKLCGCVISPVFSPESYEVSVDVTCNCDDSSVNMSTPMICNGVNVYLCTTGSTSCYNTTYATYRVEDGPSYTVTYDAFDTPILIEQGNRITIEFYNDLGCCYVDSVIIDETQYHVIGNTVSFEAFEDTHVCVLLKSKIVSLKYLNNCCPNLYKVRGFYDYDTSVQYAKNCDCGTNLIFKIERLRDCVSYYFTLNGNRVPSAEVFEDHNEIYFLIESVSTNISVEVGVDFSGLEPVFETPVIEENGEYIEITDTCYEYQFFQPCINSKTCDNFCFGLEFNGGDCECNCKYEIKKIEYQWYNIQLEKPEWTNIDTCVPVDEFIVYTNENDCHPIHVRALLMYKHINVTFVTGNVQPSDLEFVYTYDGTTGTAHAGDMITLEYYENNTLYVQGNFTDPCVTLKDITIKGCGKVTHISTSEISLSDFCGNIYIIYNFAGGSVFNVSISVYDEETQEPSDLNCVAVSNGMIKPDVVACGKQFESNVILSGCCTSIARIVDSTEGGVSLLTLDQNNNLIINNIHENHNIRIYVNHNTYTTKIFYKLDCVGCDCDENDINKCLRISCDNSLHCEDIYDEGTGNFLYSECEYFCDDKMTFTELHPCDPNFQVCCEKIFSVKQTNGFEYGLESDFDQQTKTWASQGSYRTETNLSNINLQNGNYVILVKCECSERSDFIVPEEDFSIIPIDNVGNVLAPSNCLIYSFTPIHLPDSKLCTLGVRLRASSNDCFSFTRWLVLNENNGYDELSRDEAYDFYTCDIRTVYAEFEKHESTQIITVDMIVLEQDLSPYNQNMHTNPYSPSVLPESNLQTVSGKCGQTASFSYINEHPDLFSLQGIYYYDSFYHTYTPCMDIDVMLHYEGDKEVYEFETYGCESANYRLVLVPNDYITFYNYDCFTSPQRNISFSMGYYYEMGEQLYDVIQSSTQDSMLPDVSYWNGSTWANVPFNYTTNLFTIQNIVDFLMVRINTPVINNKKCGNHLDLSPSINDVFARIDISVSGQNGRFAIAGSILSLAFGSDGYTLKSLPDYFAKEIFKHTRPVNIFGYAFKNVKDVGDYGMYNMFFINITQISTSDNVSTDYVMFDNLVSIGNSGCSYLFASSNLSYVSFDNLQTIGANGCLSMFENSKRIDFDLRFDKLRTVGNSGCFKMFKNSDGASILTPSQPQYPINVSFSALSQVYQNSFDYIFFGNQLMSMNLSITNPMTISVDGFVFKEAFKESGLKTADISGIIIPSNLHSTMNQCFVDTEITELRVGCSFDFAQYDPSTNPHPSTDGWVDGGGVAHPVFYCSATCRDNANLFGRDSNTVPSNWTITTITCS